MSSITGRTPPLHDAGTSLRRRRAALTEAPGSPSGAAEASALADDQQDECRDDDADAHEDSAALLPGLAPEPPRVAIVVADWLGARLTLAPTSLLSGRPESESVTAALM
ncbi:hypothetical protein Srufu_069600 [Streptomyces libani subsp. rufus]|nr:hypothetical protein Srufu_069600 [Streptomyces libani subsp. rufus]